MKRRMSVRGGSGSIVRQGMLRQGPGRLSRSTFIDMSSVCRYRSALDSTLPGLRAWCLRVSKPIAQSVPIGVASDIYISIIDDELLGLSPIHERVRPHPDS